MAEKTSRNMFRPFNVSLIFGSVAVGESVAPEVSAVQKEESTDENVIQGKQRRPAESIIQETEVSAARSVLQETAASEESTSQETKEDVQQPYALEPAETASETVTPETETETSDASKNTIAKNGFITENRKFIIIKIIRKSWGRNCVLTAAGIILLKRPGRWPSDGQRIIRNAIITKKMARWYTGFMLLTIKPTALMM